MDMRHIEYYGITYIHLFCSVIGSIDINRILKVSDVHVHNLKITCRNKILTIRNFLVMFIEESGYFCVVIYWSHVDAVVICQEQRGPLLNSILLLYIPRNPGIKRKLYIGSLFNKGVLCREAKKKNIRLATTKKKIAGNIKTHYRVSQRTNKI